MSLDMVCNFRKCRKCLTSNAWVTSCSHAFCGEHGAREFRRNENGAFTCPACGAELKDKFDVIQADLNPTETFKSIVLAGMKPDTIMDIAMRAISFWSYQLEQETLYQETQAKHAREKVQCLEEMNVLNVQKLKAELQTCNRRAAAMQAEYDRKRKQTEELTAALEERNRRIQKLNFQLEAQKRKGVNINTVEDDTRHKEGWSHVEDMVNSRTGANNFKFRPVNARNRPPPAVKSPSFFDFSQSKIRHNGFNFKPV